MEYGDWLIALYDKFSKEYETKYPSNKKSIKSLPFGKKVKLVIMMVLLIIGVGMYIYGLVKNDSVVLVIGILAEGIMFLVGGTTKIDIERFKQKVFVLEKVLEDEKLDNEITIKKLEKSSRGIERIIKESNILNLLSVIGSFIGTIGLTTAIQRASDGILSVILLGSFLLVGIIASGYFLLIGIPGTKISRKKQLNELLRILIVYKGYK